jgi:hypothetical protein
LAGKQKGPGIEPGPFCFLGEFIRKEVKNHANHFYCYVVCRVIDAIDCRRFCHACRAA